MNAIATLYVEELKAAARGRFAWLGAGVVLLAVGGLATVGTQDTWLDGYGIVAYFLVPLAFLPFAAVAIASPRANRFVESVFTAPVDRRDWLLAKILVLLTLAAVYYVSLVPMMLVYVHHVGLPFLLKKFLVWTPGILLASIAVGTLVGVLFIGRSVAAPAATGMGVLLAYAGLVPLQELLVAQGNGATHTGAITLASPATLLKNGLGFTLVASSIPATTTWTWLCFGGVTLGALALAGWVFLRTQGVETWETTRTQRWTIALAMLALFLAPMLLADRNYDLAAPPASNAPAVRGLFARAAGNLALTTTGGRFPARCCATILNRDMWPPFGTDKETRQDLLVLLPVDASQQVTELTIRVTGEAGLVVTADADVLAHALDRLEPHDYAGEFAPMGSDGRRLVRGWVARIPVALNPTHPWDIGGDRYPLTVTATYRVAGDDKPRTLNARAAIDAQVASGIYEMGAASLLLPLVCFVASFRRWRRTR